MKHAELVNLQVDDSQELIRTRTIMASLTDLRPLSQAGGYLAIAPEFTAKEAQALLNDFLLIYRHVGSSSVDLTLRKGGIFVQVHFGLGGARFEVMSSDDAADEALAALLKRFKPHLFVNQEEDGVWVDFTYRDSCGVARQTQFLKCPTWEEIQANYPAQTRLAVDRLLGQKTPWLSGRLIIWHGLPGTGKTYAIRAMLQEWKDRFDFIVINDPEQFAASPGYYYSIASRNTQLPKRLRMWPIYDEVEEGDEVKTKSARRRRLFLLEDSADLVMQESRTNHHEKLGKLLNMTDGLYGQGREDLFLITFNEALTQIDPAFLRPGRCVTMTEFSKFAPKDASSWLQEHGASAEQAPQDLSIAELYARTLVGKPAELRKPLKPQRIGFTKELA